MEKVPKKGDGYKRFLIIWLGELVSNIGSGMTAFGLGVYVWQLTHSAVDVAMVEMAALLPMILLCPAAGVLADRFDRRLLMILGDIIAPLGLVIMLVLIGTGNIQVWQICLCVGFNSAFTALLDPAYKATITDLLTEDEYAKASGMVSVASSSKFLISPVIGGLVLAVSGIEMILAMDILTFVVTIAAVIAVRKSFAVKSQGKKEIDFFKDLKEGWLIILESKGVMLLIVLVSALMFYMGFIQVLSKPMLLSFASEQTTGILQTVAACGMMVSSIMIGSGTFKRKYVNVMVASFVAAGLTMAGFGATTSIPVIIITGFLFFASLPYATTSIDVLIRKSIDNEKQGRAWGIISLISQLGFVIAYAFAGILADYVFNPALAEGGVLADTVGKIIGTGETRGIGFLIILAGLGLIITALAVSGSKTIRNMETPNVDTQKGEVIMFLKIVRNDCSRKKVITATVFVFITLAVILGASATNIIANLIQSMSELQKSAAPADITQMHAGDYHQAAIDKFTEEQQANIAMQETMVLLNIEGSNIHFGNNETMAGTVQDISFVVQNKKFDFILNLDNEKLDVKEGEVAVPIYFMVKHDFKPGDRITVKYERYQKEFVISDYARDYEMNSSLTSSKRFVIHQADYDEMLEKQVGEPEYLIEFKLKENGDAQAVQTAYIEAGLPANGPTVGGSIFLLFNAMSDATVVMVIILISILLVIIAAFCIRLTFLATIDEDLREIGVMKAMGISKKDIKKVYLNKYRVMSVAAGIIGYLLSFAVVNLFNGNMRLYLSSDLSGNLKFVLSLLAPLFVYFMIVMYCRKVLKRIDKISAVEALRSDVMERGKNRKYSFPLLKNRLFSTNIYMGLRDVWKRFKLYRLLIFIFIVSTFIVILPLNMYNTMNSPEFSTYMGIGKCDMRIDLRRTDTITEDFIKLQQELQKDPDIEKHAAYITCSYQVKNAEGSWDYIYIETGDFSVFPLNYLEGRAPEGEGEISLSYANASADGLNKKVGDDVVVKVAGKEKTMKVCGIYQDVTNGGKTAKADTSLGLNEDAVLWYIVNMDVAPGVDISKKMEYYQNVYASAQVNDIKEYTQQTLGNIIEQMSTIVIGGIAIAVIIVALITALFLKMLLSKDMSRIAIMRSVGLTSNNIKHQYMAGTLLVLVLGIILGVLASEYLGELLVSMAMSSMGAARIEFVHIAWQTWLLCPLVLIAAVGFTISMCCKAAVKDDLSVVLRA